MIWTLQRNALYRVFGFYIRITKEGDSMRRVVITGLGLVAPTGNNLRDAWNATLEARSGIARITHFDADRHEGSDCRRSERFCVARCSGCQRRTTHELVLYFLRLRLLTMPCKDSGLDTSKNPERYGCIIGVGMGGLPDIEANAIILKEKGEKRISPFFIPYAIPNMAAGYVSIAS